jgi:hypothetical protein
MKMRMLFLPLMVIALVLSSCGNEKEKKEIPLSDKKEIAKTDDEESATADKDYRAA